MFPSSSGKIVAAGCDVGRNVGRLASRSQNISVWLRETPPVGCLCKATKRQRDASHVEVVVVLVVEIVEPARLVQRPDRSAVRLAVLLSAKPRKLATPTQPSKKGW
jgi:hypothetical protein